MNTLTKATKAEFARHATLNGLHLLGSPWNTSIEKVCQAIDKQGDSILNNIGDNRQKVTGTVKHLTRHKPDGFTSHLRLGADDTVYRYGNFWLVRGEFQNGSNNTIIYT